MNILVASTFAQDVIINNHGTHVVDGGPALFISDALKKLNIPFTMVSGPKAKVEIDMRGGRELGKIINVQKIPLTYRTVPDLFIVSTVLDECELTAVGTLSCLDIQGYVREKSTFGGKKYFSSSALRDFDIIKCTAQEYNYLEKKDINEETLMIITHGDKGFLIKKNLQELWFDVERIASPDTIGAGDTFFTAFCIEYYQTNDAYTSALFAQKFVGEFLRNKIQVKTMKKLQIGVMGSAADLNYSKDIEQIAEQVGELIARSGNIVVYGAEKDYDSLSTAAARGAKRANGITVGITYGKGKNIFDKELTDIIICTGMDRGGGREFVLVNSCDAIITVSGGSGTLTEIAIAYQSNIPIICITGTSGWSEKLADTFIDERRRVKCIRATSAEDAVKWALEQIEKKESE